MTVPRRDATAATVELGDDRAAVGLHLGDRVAASRQIRYIFDAGVGEIAAGDLHAAFQKMADQSAGAQARQVRGTPTEVMRQRRQKHRWVGQPTADDDIGLGAQRGENSVGAEIGVHADHRHANVRERALLVHEWLIVRQEGCNVVTLDARDLQPFQTQFAGDLDGARNRGPRIGGAHVGDHGGARRHAGRQERMHAALEMRVVASRRVRHAIAMAEGHRALAQAFQHQYVEFAALDQVDRRDGPVGGEARPGTNTKLARDHAQSPFSP